MHCLINLDDLHLGKLCSSVCNAAIEEPTDHWATERTFCPSSASLCSPEAGKRITLLILPKDPTRLVTSSSDASFGMPVK